jgi:CRP/FNR family cyclic AMP-dependent transcriptional regulator
LPQRREGVIATRLPADSALLSCVPLFERLNEEERSLLAAQLEEETFSAGTLLFRKGEPGNAIYIVASGEVEIFVEGTTGERIVFETAKTGDFFGELSLLDGDPRSASAKAISDAKTLKVDRSDLQLLFSRHPAAAMDILAAIGRRLREADKLLGMRVPASPNQAIAERLSLFDRLADFVAAFSGTFSFLLLHVAWFALWLMVNGGFFPTIPIFDPYPYQFLTMVVSLEAIFLSCLVLISQSRQAAKDRIRSDVEYEANIRAGLEVTQLHVKVDQLYEQVLARLAGLERKVAGPPPSSSGPKN